MESKARCEVCDAVIPQQRLRVLPHTTTCVRCSRVFGYTEDDVDLVGSDPEDMIHACQNVKEQS